MASLDLCPLIRQKIPDTRQVGLLEVSLDRVLLQKERSDVPLEVAISIQNPNGFLGAVIFLEIVEKVAVLRTR